MSMDEARIKQIYEYFQKCGNRRYGDWVTEIRRSLCMELIDSNVNYNSIAKLLNVHRTSAYHYQKFKINKMISDVVRKNKWYWIENGLYPMTVYISVDGVVEMMYELTEDPKYFTKKRVGRPKMKSTDMDRLIDSL
jgi:hypothetical protein